jgi:hypothetical protein
MKEQSERIAIYLISFASLEHDPKKSLARIRSGLDPVFGKYYAAAVLRDLAEEHQRDTEKRIRAGEQSISPLRAKSAKIELIA